MDVQLYEGVAVLFKLLACINSLMTIILCSCSLNLNHSCWHISFGAKIIADGCRCFFFWAIFLQ